MKYLQAAEDWILNSVKYQKDQKNLHSVSKESKTFERELMENEFR